MYIYILVGGLEHVFVFFHTLGIIIPTDDLIFFRGVETTNQYHLYHCWISELTMDFQHLPAVKSKLSSTRPLYLARPGGWKDSWHRSGGDESQQRIQGGLWKGRCSAWENEFTHQKMRLTIQKKTKFSSIFLNSDLVYLVQDHIYGGFLK